MNGTVTGLKKAGPNWYPSQLRGINFLILLSTDSSDDTGGGGSNDGHRSNSTADNTHTGTGNSSRKGNIRSNPAQTQC